MAKYTVTHSCGHESEIQLFGAQRQRAWRLEREAERVCPDCYRAEQAKKREEAAGNAALEASSRGLLPLRGTEKQVKWAEQIRAEWMAGLDKLGAEIQAEITEKGLRAEEVEENAYWQAFQAIRARAMETTEAKWWIDYARSTAPRFAVQDRSREIRRDQAAAELRASGPITAPAELPELEGSPKQVSWAKEIRAEWAGQVEAAAARILTAPWVLDREAVREVIREVVGKIFSWKQARSYIDRYTTASRKDSFFNTLQEAVLSRAKEAEAKKAEASQEVPHYTPRPGQSAEELARELGLRILGLRERGVVVATISLGEGLPAAKAVRR